MLLPVNEFCNLVQRDLNGLIYALQKETSRNMTPQEMVALQSSYRAVSSLFRNVIQSNSRFAQVHISTSDMFLEYKLPSASSWCDLILLGNNRENEPKVIIIELKDWGRTSTDMPSDDEGLIIHNGNLQLHPSEQVRGYTEYCQRFHSAVLDYKSTVSGLVFFSQDIDITPYCVGGNVNLTRDYPMYNTTQPLLDNLANFILDTIDKPNNEFANDFQNGYYKQDRDIMKQVADLLKVSATKNKGFNIVSPFVLLEAQRKGYNQVMSSLYHLQEGQKDVIIVKGPPGSGKSAIAINVWIQCALKYGVEKSKGNVVFATTSSSQYFNWEHIFTSCGGREAGGMILKSTKFNPGINSSNVNASILEMMREIDENKYIGIKDNGNEYLKKEYYKDYTNALIKKGTHEYKDNLHYITIVDEAHSLFNPMNPSFGATNQWMQQAGPQAYHIIRESQISVFFMDDKQSFRDIETTSVNDICQIAKDLGVSPTIVSLEGMQFRCAGSADFMEWVEALFSDSPLKNHDKWEKQFQLTLVDYPSDLEQVLRNKHNNGDTVRILSSYTEEWKSKGKIDKDHSNSGDVPFDFELDDKNGGKWRKYWNSGGLNGLNPDYSMFVQGNKSIVGEDPLSEVGCAYVVRGFDYDHIGVLWLEDLVIRDGKWMINIEKCPDTSMRIVRAGAKNEIQKHYLAKGWKRAEISRRVKLYPAFDSNFPQCNRLFMAISQAYRILMSRPIKSICLYIKDKDTREYVKSLL